MHNDNRARKQIKRLELRREVIRVLASEELAEVVGGFGCDPTGGPCPGSLRPTTRWG